MDEGRKDSKYSEIISWINVIVIAIVLTLVIDGVFIINANVPSGSMENTIMTKSRVLGLRTVYWNHSPQRGDIVVFKFPVAKALTRKIFRPLTSNMNFSMEHSTSTYTYQS